jgi:hypothetical protein
MIVTRRCRTRARLVHCGGGSSSIGCGWRILSTRSSGNDDDDDDDDDDDEEEDDV